jgi:hypothetical protein
MCLGTITHNELCSTVEIIAGFLADIMLQIHDIMFVSSVFGRKLNRADSKNSVMTVTRMQTKMFFNFLEFSDFKRHSVGVWL